MGFKIGKALGAVASPLTAGASLIPGVGGALGKGGGILGGIFGGAFEDKFTPADPEAQELKDIKMKGARGEDTALNRFRARLDADTSGLIRGDIARENLGLIKSQEDAGRSLMDQIKQRGMSNSSIGLNALANLQRETAKDIAGNTSSFRRRLDDENLKRLSDFRNTAAGTLSGQNVPINFTPTKEDSFAKTLLRGGITGLVQSGAKAAGGSMMGGA